MKEINDEVARLLVQLGGKAPEVLTVLARVAVPARVSPVRAVEPPTAEENKVVPVPVRVRVAAPSTAPVKVTAAVPAAKVELEPRLNAPATAMALFVVVSEPLLVKAPL